MIKKSSINILIVFYAVLWYVLINCYIKNKDEVINVTSVLIYQLIAYFSLFVIVYIYAVI